MTSVLTYVDDVLARQVATGLIGSEVRLSNRNGATVGINFKVLVRRERSTEQSTATRVSDLLPEVVADAIRDAIPERIESLDSARERLIAGGKNAFRPGTPILIAPAQLTLEGKNSSATLSGEECIQYRLQMNEFFLHAFCAKSAERDLDSLTSQPVEVVGLLRYAPAYAVPGALSLNLGLRICAVWLR